MNKNLGAVAIAVAVFAMACSDPMTPVSTLVSNGATLAITPHPINFNAGGTLPAGLTFARVRVCKTADAAGSFAFTMTVNGGASAAIPGGPIVIAGAAGGTVCRDVFTSTKDNDVAPDLVTVTEAADQTNWSLTGRNIDQYFGSGVTYPSPRLDSDNDAAPARGATVYINNDMVKVITFINHFTPPATIGCTYTKGWYRNNGSNTVIGVDGRTKANAQAIFNATPGKPGSVTFGGDNTLLNLYQQYLAALNNLGGDANFHNGPAAVDAAIDAVDLGTNDGPGVAITTSLSQSEMSGYITTLSNFNEGLLTGWPHCPD